MPCRIEQSSCSAGWAMRTRQVRARPTAAAGMPPRDGTPVQPPGRPRARRATATPALASGGNSHCSRTEVGTPALSPAATADDKPATGGRGTEAPTGGRCGLTDRDGGRAARRRTRTARRPSGRRRSRGSLLRGGTRPPAGRETGRLVRASPAGVSPRRGRAARRTDDRVESVVVW